jgi:hypothetical protein
LENAKRIPKRVHSLAHASSEPFRGPNPEGLEAPRGAGCAVGPHVHLPSRHPRSSAKGNARLRTECPRGPAYRLESTGYYETAGSDSASIEIDREGAVEDIEAEIVANLTRPRSTRVPVTSGPLFGASLRDGGFVGGHATIGSEDLNVEYSVRAGISSRLGTPGHYVEYEWSANSKTVGDLGGTVRLDTTLRSTRNVPADELVPSVSSLDSWSLCDMGGDALRWASQVVQGAATICEEGACAY